MAITISREKILNLIYDDPVQIAHFIGRDLMTELHSEWLRKFLFSDHDIVLQAHRGSYKTTTLALFFALHTLIKPQETIIYMRKTDQDVSSICREAQNILQTGCFQKMSKAIYGQKVQITKGNASEIDTNLHIGVSGQPQITGFGINSSITGQHADIVVTDDIVTLKDRVSVSEREHTKIMVQELVNIKNRGGRFIHLGTPWHHEDAFQLMSDNGQIPIDKYDCYTTGLLSQADIEKAKNKLSPDLFAANYELNTTDSSFKLFGDAHWLAKPESYLLIGGMGHIDAAYSGSDYTAFTILKKENGRYIGYGKLWDKHVDSCLNEIDALCNLYQVKTIACEDNGDKGYLAKELRTHGHQTSLYHESTNKYLKISTVLKKHWNDIYWIDDTDPMYIEQIVSYQENAKHDDAPDSCASLLRSITQEVKINTSSFLMGGF